VVFAVNNEPIIPIKVMPYEHQQEAFIFVCKMFGLVDEAFQSDGFVKKKEGDANDSNQ